MPSHSGLLKPIWLLVDGKTALLMTISNSHVTVLLQRGRQTKRITRHVDRVYLAPASLNDVTNHLTAFTTFDALLNAINYRPTMLQQDGLTAILANTYDAYQAERGDPRRAFRGTSCSPSKPTTSPTP